MVQKSVIQSEKDKATQHKKVISKWRQIQSLLNTLNHILICLVALYMTFLCRSLDFIDTAVHALMASIGFHLLAAEAIMCHYSENPLTNKFSHRTRTLIHTVMQIIGGSMGLLAAVGKFSKTEVHFTTIHGKFGLATALLCACSMLGGLVNFFSSSLRKYVKPAQIKLGHNLFGLLTFLSAMTTIFFGYRTGFFDKYVDAEFVPLISTATVLVAILSAFGPIRSLFGKIKLKK